MSSELEDLKLSSEGGYEKELEAAKAQLLVFAREISAVYLRERRQAQHLGALMDELRADYLSIIQTLALLVEAKDEYTRSHLDRCREYGTALANEIEPGMATPELQYGFLLHDIGKIGVPEAILGKVGPLTYGEMEIMKTHPLVGIQLIGPMRRIVDERTLEVIRSHHERFDGDGYPDELKGEQIPLAARIFSVVDAYDAMTSDRPYREALTFEEAIRRLRSGAGTQFDPAVVVTFEELMRREREAAQI